MLFKPNVSKTKFSTSHTPMVLDRNGRQKYAGSHLSPISPHCTVAIWVDTQCQKANKTVVLTNEGQPPQHLQLPRGEWIAILEHNFRPKKYRLYIDGTRLQIASYQPQQTSKAFYANRWILQDHQVSRKRQG